MEYFCLFFFYNEINQKLDLTNWEIFLGDFFPQNVVGKNDFKVRQFYCSPINDRLIFTQLFYCPFEKLGFPRQRKITFHFYDEELFVKKFERGFVRPSCILPLPPQQSRQISQFWKSFLTKKTNKFLGLISVSIFWWKKEGKKKKKKRREKLHTTQVQKSTKIL